MEEAFCYSILMSVTSMTVGTVLGQGNLNRFEVGYHTEKANGRGGARLPTYSLMFHTRIFVVVNWLRFGSCPSDKYPSGHYCSKGVSSEFSNRQFASAGMYGSANKWCTFI